MAFFRRARAVLSWTAAVGASAGCAPGDEPVTASRDARIEGHGTVWVANLGQGEVLGYDLATGEMVHEIVPEPFVAPSAVLRVDGGLLIADFETGDVLELGGDGATAPRYRNGVDGVRLEEPCALRATDAGEVVALGNDSRNLVVLGPDDQDRRELGDEPIRSPHGFDVLPSGELVVGTSPVYRDLGLVQVLDPDTGAVRRHFAPWPELQEATDVRVGPDGALWVADWFAGEVSRYTLDGERLGVVAGDLDGPVALADGPDGDPLVLTGDGVWRVSEDGPVQVVDGAGRFVWARGLFWEP